MSDDVRERVAEIIADYAIDFAASVYRPSVNASKCIPSDGGAAAWYIADRILALLDSGGEPEAWRLDLLWEPPSGWVTQEITEDFTEAESWGDHDPDRPECYRAVPLYTHPPTDTGETAGKAPDE